MGSFTVLTDPSSARGRADEPPPPPAPRGSSKSSKSGGQIQDSKHGHWKRYTDSPGVGSPPPPPPPAPPSPPSSRRERKNSPHGGSGSKEKGSKVKGVPQSFGYIKRNSSGSNGTSCITNGTSIPISSKYTCIYLVKWFKNTLCAVTWILHEFPVWPRRIYVESVGIVGAGSCPLSLTCRTLDELTSLKSIMGSKSTDKELVPVCLVVRRSLPVIN